MGDASAEVAAVVDAIVAAVRVVDILGRLLLCGEETVCDALADIPLPRVPCPQLQSVVVGVACL